MFTFTNRSKMHLVIGDFTIGRGHVVQRQDIDVAQMSYQQTNDMNYAVAQGWLTVAYAADPNSVLGSPIANWPYGQTP